MPFKSREKYNEYMRAYKQKRWEDISLLLDFFKEHDDFHVFICQDPIEVATIPSDGLQTFLEMAPKVGIHPESMRHYQVKLVES